MKMLSDLWGKFWCAIGRHKWRPDKGAVMSLDWRSKWEAYEVASKGHCIRKDCTATAENIRRDYFW